MSYGTTFALWRVAAGGIWRDYTHHAFVEGMRDGTLPRDAFLRYLVQDYLFLVHFSRAWALAVTKAETLEEMRVCAATVHALLNEEMRLHVETCAAEGISEAELFAAREASQQTPYAEWIATYSGADYQRSCREVGALIDAAVARRLGAASEVSPRWSGLCARFQTATRLEVDFWSMGLSG